MKEQAEGWKRIEKGVTIFPKNNDFLLKWEDGYVSRFYDNNCTHIISEAIEYCNEIPDQQTQHLLEIEKFITSYYGSMIQGEKYISENVLISKINKLKGRVIFDDTDQLNPDVKTKMDNFFANVSPEYLVEKFEKMGYTFTELSVVNTLAVAIEKIKHICRESVYNDFEIDIYNVCTKALIDVALKKPIPRNITGPFPTETVLEHLIWATEYLLHRKDYDGPNYEELEICVQNAKVIKATLVVRNNEKILINALEKIIQALRENTELVLGKEKIINIAEVALYEYVPPLDYMLQKRWGDEWHDLPNQKEGREIDGIYRKVPRIPQIKWISVEDRLPTQEDADRYCEVLVQFKDGATDVLHYEECIKQAYPNSTLILWHPLKKQ